MPRPRGRAGRAGAGRGTKAHVIDVEVARKVEYLLPGRSCPCCGTVTFAEPPPGAYPGSVSYGPALNAAAVVLTAYGNVPSERAARLIGMLPWLGGLRRVGGQGLCPAIGAAGVSRVRGGDACRLATEKVLAADETPVAVLDKAVPAAPAMEEAADQDEGRPAAAGPPHVMIVRTPDERLTFLQAIASRRKEAVN